MFMPPKKYFGLLTMAFLFVLVFAPVAVPVAARAATGDVNLFVNGQLVGQMAIDPNASVDLKRPQDKFYLTNLNTKEFPNGPATLRVVTMSDGQEVADEVRVTIDNPPGNFFASGGNDIDPAYEDKISLSWTGVNDPTLLHYQLFRDDTIYRYLSSAATRFDDTNIVAGIIYRYKICPERRDRTVTACTPPNAGSSLLDAPPPAVADIIDLNEIKNRVTSCLGALSNSANWSQCSSGDIDKNGVINLVDLSQAKNCVGKTSTTEICRRVDAVTNPPLPPTITPPPPPVVIASKDNSNNVVVRVTENLSAPLNSTVALFRSIANRGCGVGDLVVNNIKGHPSTFSIGKTINFYDSSQLARNVSFYYSAQAAVYPPVVGANPIKSSCSNVAEGLFPSPSTIIPPTTPPLTTTPPPTTNPPSNNPTEITLLSPLSGLVYPADEPPPAFPIQFKATDSDGIVQMQVFLNNVLKQTTTLKCPDFKTAFFPSQYQTYQLAGASAGDSVLLVARDCKNLPWVQAYTVNVIPASRTSANARTIGPLLESSLKVLDSRFPKLSLSDESVAEGDAGWKNLKLTARLSAPAATDIFANFTSADGTATLQNQDYSPANGSLHFPVGQTSVAVTVYVKGDTAVEADEHFLVRLANPTGGAILGAAEVQVTIKNDDSVAPPSTPPVTPEPTPTPTPTPEPTPISEPNPSLSLLPAPTNVVATDGAYETRIRISWKGINTSAKYEVWRAESEAGPWTKITTTATYNAGISIGIDNTPTANTRFYYKVIAVDPSGNRSPDSNVDSGYRGTLPTTFAPSDWSTQIGAVFQGLANWFRGRER